MLLLHIVTFGIGIVGVSVIIWGVVTSLREFVAAESHGFDGKDTCRRREILRHHLGSYLLLGLEFMIAADIVDTIVRPTMNELIVLGSIVAIRTVLSFSLSKELAGHNRSEG
jgi:uncharacterized membrane protein